MKRDNKTHGARARMNANKLGIKAISSQVWLGTIKHVAPEPILSCPNYFLPQDVSDWHENLFLTGYHVHFNDNLARA